MTTPDDYRKPKVLNYPMGNFTDKVMELLPDGPPDDSLREAVALVELVTAAGGTPEDREKFIKINTDRQYRVEMDSGTSLDARKQTRKTWNIVMASPTAPGGQRLKQTYSIEGEKMDALLGLMQLANDHVLVKTKLRDCIRQYCRLHDACRIAKGDDCNPHGACTRFTHADPKEPRAFQAVRETMADDEDSFDTLYKFSRKASDKGYLLDFQYLGIKDSDLSGFAAWRNEGMAGHMEFVATIALHELWIDYHNQAFQEELEMAHSEGRGPVWWRIYGSSRNINKCKNSLNNNSHMLVLDSETQIFLRIQDSEKKFVEDLTSQHQLRAKMVEEPEWGEAACGKKHTNSVAHERRCNSCHREKSNQARAAEAAARAAETAALDDTSAPVPIGAVGKATANKAKTGYGMRTVPPTNGKKVEEKHWEARNGPVITVQGPQEFEEDDYEAQAKENRRVADELLSQATYYERLAEHFEALCQPTPSVQAAETAYEIALKKAQQILDDAKAQVDAERSSQKDALKELIASGPPA
jgi:hypothetical protein